jgi:hypothetical protein
MAAAAPKDNPAVFLTLGHGDDDITVNFESRERLPEGFTLVTLAQCGVVTNEHAVFPIMDAFSNPDMKDILQDPLANKETISRLVGGLPLYIYKQGDLVPELGLHLLLDWIKKPDGSNKERTIFFSKSGVYKFPVSEGFNLGGAPGAQGEDVEINPKYKYISARWSMLLEEPVELENKEEFVDLYKNSVFPTQDEISKIVDDNKMNFKAVKEATKHKLSTVFDRLGPGVYYFVVCRSIRQNTDSGYLLKKIVGYNKDENQNVPSLIKNNYNKFKLIRNNYSKTLNRVKLYPSIFPYLLAAAKNIRNVDCALGNDLNDPRVLKRNFRNVTRIRRKSLEQQEKYLTKAAEEAGVGVGAGGGVGAVGGAGGPPAPILDINFKPLTNDSSLEEVLSELPLLKMKGVNHEILLKSYEEMMELYPKFSEDIKTDLHRVVIKTLKKIGMMQINRREKIALLDSQIATINVVYKDYEPIITAANNYVKDVLLRELPNLTTLPDDELLLREYEEMIERYPESSETIQEKMSQFVISSLTKISRLADKSQEEINALLDSRLETIRRVFEKYGSFLEYATRYVDYLKAPPENQYGGVRRSSTRRSSTRRSSTRRRYTRRSRK